MPNIIADWRPGRTFKFASFFTTTNGAEGNPHTEYEVLRHRGAEYRYVQLDRQQIWYLYGEAELLLALELIEWIAEPTAVELSEWRIGRFFKVRVTFNVIGRMLMQGSIWQIVEGGIRPAQGGPILDCGSVSRMLRFVDFNPAWETGKLFRFNTIPAGITGIPTPQPGYPYLTTGERSFKDPRNNQEYSFEEDRICVIPEAIDYIKSAAEEFVAGRHFTIIDDVEIENWEFAKDDTLEILSVSPTRAVLKWEEGEDTLATADQAQLLPWVIFDNPLPGWKVKGARFKTISNVNYYGLSGTFQIESFNSNDQVLLLKIDPPRPDGRPPGAFVINPTLMRVDDIKWLPFLSRVKFTELSKDLQNLIRESPQSTFVRGFVRAELGVAPDVKDTPKTAEDWVKFVESTSVKTFIKRFPTIQSPIGPHAEVPPPPPPPLLAENENIPLTGETVLLRVELNERVAGFQNWTRNDYYGGDIAVPIEILDLGSDRINEWIRANYDRFLDPTEGEEMWGDREITDEGDITIEHTNLETILAERTTPTNE